MRNDYKKYRFDSLYDYFAQNGISNVGKDIKIEWIIDTKYCKNIKVIDFNKVIWSFGKILHRTETNELIREIEKILADIYNIHNPIKVMTTVDDVNKIEAVVPVIISASLTKKGIYNKFGSNKKNDIFSKTYGKEPIKKNKPNIYATVAKDNDVYEENEKQMAFNEIVGFRIYNKEKNVAICLDYWKDDEKIVLRLANKETGKISKVLFQKTIDEIIKEVADKKIEVEKTSGFN